MPKFIWNIPDEQYALLKERSTLTGAPIAFLLRQAVSQYFCSGFAAGVVIDGVIASGSIISVQVGG